MHFAIASVFAFVTTSAFTNIAVAATSISTEHSLTPRGGDKMSYFSKCKTVRDCQNGFEYCMSPPPWPWRMTTGWYSRRHEACSTAQTSCITRVSRSSAQAAAPLPNSNRAPAAAPLSNSNRAPAAAPLPNSNPSEPSPPPSYPGRNEDRLPNSNPSEPSPPPSYPGRNEDRLPNSNPSEPPPSYDEVTRPRGT